MIGIFNDGKYYVVNESRRSCSDFFPNVGTEYNIVFKLGSTAKYRRIIKIKDLVDSLASYSNAPHLIISTDSIKYCYEKEKLIELDKGHVECLNNLWNMSEEKVSEFDKGMKKYIVFMDDFYDCVFDIGVGQPKKFSEYYDAFIALSKSISDVVKDTSVSVYLFDKRCFSTCFNETMPSFVKCYNPYDVAKIVSNMRG